MTIDWWFDYDRLEEDRLNGVLPGSNKLIQYLSEEDFLDMTLIAKNTKASEIGDEYYYPLYPNQTILEHIYTSPEGFSEEDLKPTWYDLTMLYQSLISWYVEKKEELSDIQKIGLTNAISSYLGTYALLDYTYHGKQDKSLLALIGAYKLLSEDSTDPSSLMDEELYSLTLLRYVHDMKNRGEFIDIESYLNGNYFELNIIRPSDLSKKQDFKLVQPNWPDDYSKIN